MDNQWRKKFQAGQPGPSGVLGAVRDRRPVPDPAEHFSPGLANLPRLGLDLAPPLLQSFPGTAHLLPEPDTLESG